MVVATLNGVPSRKPLVTLVIDEDLLERIDDFRFGMRIGSRSEAIRWLIEAALDQQPAAEPDMSKKGTTPARPIRRKGVILKRANEPP